MLPLLSLSLFLAIVSYSQAAGLAVAGLCQDSLLNISSTKNLDECKQLGQSTPGATWVSFRPADGGCGALAGCKRLDNSLTGVLSISVVRQPHCRVNAACRGPKISTSMTNDSNACLDQCTAQPGCSWFSFQEGSGVCYALDSCDVLVERNRSWVSGESSCSSSHAPKYLNQDLIWTRYGRSQLGEMILVSRNKSRSCRLTPFPMPNVTDMKRINSDEFPLLPPTFYRLTVLEYIDHLGKVATCGDQWHNGTLACYTLQPGAPDTPPAWEQINSFGKKISSSTGFVRSHYRSDVSSWYVFGAQRTHTTNKTDAGLVSEKLIEGRNWHRTPDTSSPYPNGFAGGACSVLLNNSIAFITGGLRIDENHTLSSSFMLDLNTFTWTEVAKMITPRAGHGCVVDKNNEVLIAGGLQNVFPTPKFLSTVHIYNPVTDSWREDKELPVKNGTLSTVLLWNQRLVAPEAGTDKLWERKEDRSWELMNTTLGGIFQGVFSSLALVPAGLYQCP